MPALPGPPETEMNTHLPMRLSFLTLLGAAALPGSLLAPEPSPALTPAPTPPPAAPLPPSSHREAPFTTERPKVDATDFYLFRSYEPGREGFVTLIANYMPLEAPYGGPNYFYMDPEALYEIHVDNDGYALEDLTFQFRFQNQFQQQAL